MTQIAEGYNFAYLDERTKKMIRRALLKAVAIPGHQVPFGSREMPLPYGWGTGGIQVTASVLGALARIPPTTARRPPTSPNCAVRVMATSRWKTIFSTSFIGAPRIGAFAAGAELHAASDWKSNIYSVFRKQSATD